MIHLHQFFPAFGFSTASSFCLKMETYMRMAEIPYEIIVVDDPRKSPVGKLPYITDGAETITDSDFIIAYLKEKYGNPLDEWLNPEQKAQALTIQRTIEESLYWSAMYSRWVDPKGWEKLQPAFFKVIPWPVRGLISTLIRKKITRDLKGHGRGLHNKANVAAIGMTDIDALSTLLGDKSYFMGDKPSSVDACAYGLLALIAYVPIESPLKEHLLTKTNLIAHTDRIKAAYF
ncbi:MAG: glutathione S-transferase family protein [Alphaproteobacteria bacterium]|nr:glutathione S-transferase family protein [Rhodospirillales bacterium]MCW9044998.1 glutathione S-transferase family protein [Alphaproteobacteria bacterium]